VIDPTKVVRSALQNAASIASFLPTTEAVISVIPERHQHEAGSMSGLSARMYCDR
jgi:chaperonin GroEL